MGALSVAHWILVRTLRQGSSWAWLAVLVAYEPLVGALAPFHIGERSQDPRAPFELAFVGALIGSLYALGPLGQAGTLWRATGSLQRAIVESAGLLAAAAPFSITPLLSAWVFHGLGHGHAFALTEIAGPLAWMHLHLAALGLVVLRFRAPTSVRCAFLVSFAWVLPILSLTSEGEAGWIAFLLGASLHAERPEVASAGWIALASIAALWWLALLLGPPRSEQR